MDKFSNISTIFRTILAPVGAIKFSDVNYPLPRPQALLLGWARCAWSCGTDAGGISRSQRRLGTRQNYPSHSINLRYQITAWIEFEGCCCRFLFFYTVFVF